jgi:hypothetical protein
MPVIVMLKGFMDVKCCIDRNQKLNSYIYSSNLGSKKQYGGGGL